MYNREINSLVKHLHPLIAEMKSKPELSELADLIIETISVAIKKENPKFNIREFKDRIFK